MIYYDDIDLLYLGLKEQDFINDFYYRTFEVDNLTSDLDILIAEEKVKHLFELKDKYQIENPKNIILFDDKQKNIDYANKYGFSSIIANNKSCGLPNDIEEKIKEIILWKKKINPWKKNKNIFKNIFFKVWFFF